MLKFTSEEVVERIEQHWQNLLLIRSVSPYLKDFMAGRRDSPTAPYYTNRGYVATVWFDEPLTTEKISAINRATHWVNQGFVVRLFAFLDYCGIYGTIDQGIDGHDEIDILRRLRNWFAHTSGDYDPRDSEQRKTYERIINHFNLDPKSYPEADNLFPIPINQVLAPLVEGCKRYVVAGYNRQTQNTVNAA